MAILQILIAGVIATATLDVWQQVLRVAFGMPITDWAMIGRWVGHLPEGQLVQPDIAEAPPVANERRLGWIVHYIVGVGYAVAYFCLMWFVFRAPPTLCSALLFGAASVCVTWFFMEPILGAGVMGAKIPERATAMAHDFTSHLSLGAGLYVGNFVARALFGV